MSIFQKMAKAKVQGRGIKIAEDGDFLVRVDKIKTEPSNQGHGILWVVEYTIKKGTLTNPEGAERSWVQRPEHRAQTDLGNIKAFIAALEGVGNPNEYEFDEATFEEAVSEEQPYTGHLLRLTTQMVETKAGFKFCVHTWSPAEGASMAPPAPASAVSTTSSPPAPPVALVELTKESWLAGEGPGTPHPTAVGWEYHPQHIGWGCRKLETPF